jgi:4-hydroxyphenylpyruvate dioxygenase-like putative hemolysin
MLDVSKRPAGLLGLMLEEAEIKDEVIYHVGYYAAGPHKKDAYELYKQGKCVLYQRKQENGFFQYIAQKR